MLGFELSTLGWCLVGLVVFIASYIYLTWPYGYFKKMGIPGPKPIPVMGNMGEFGKQPFWMKDAEWVKKYGSVLGYYMFQFKGFMITDKEMLKDIFIKDFDHFCDRPTISNRGVMSKSLTDVKGDVWRNQRHHLSRYFATGTLKMGAKPINKVMDNFVAWLGEKSEKGEMIEAKDTAQMVTLDVICSTAFGVEVNSCKNPDMEILKQSRDFVKQFTTGNILLMLVVMFPMFGKLMDLLNIEFMDIKYFETFTKQLIEQRRKMTDEQGHDFINVLLKEKKGSLQGLSDEEIIANAVLFLIAGYDTTSGSLSFLMYFLALFPDYQEKLYQDIQEHIGNEVPTYEMVQKLTYLDMCIDETLRLYPLAPRIDRTCVKDIVLKGVKIEKGTTITMPTWHIHRNPEIWEDPETFNPERFAPEKKAAMDPLDYAPFGIGPRNCIGMRLALFEMKIAMIRILQKFKIVKNEKTQVPLELDPKVFAMKAKDGIWVSLERRES